VTDDVPSLVLELALRSLDQQEREVSELRARTNTVIAAAALAASFLGSAAIREHGGLSVWSVLALVVLFITGGVSLYVLWPRQLSFAFDARATYAELYSLLDRVAEAQLRVAYAARDRYRSTSGRLTTSRPASKSPWSPSACRLRSGLLPSR
jgi:hypothetical protein